jgi:hypothetical protein
MHLVCHRTVLAQSHILTEKSDWIARGFRTIFVPALDLMTHCGAE